MEIEMTQTASNTPDVAVGTKAVTISLTPNLFKIWKAIKKGRRSEFVKIALLYVGTFKGADGTIDPDGAIDEMRRLFDARKAKGN